MFNIHIYIFVEMATYTPGEYVDMIIAYGIAEENASAAARIYVERFPDRDRHPDSKTILRCVQRARETGDLLSDRGNSGAPVQSRVAEEEEKILREFEENPKSSIRRVAEKLGISRYMVHRIVRQNGIHPYAE